jgi:hypothetical protein
MPVLWVLWGIGVLNVVAMFVSVWVYQLLVRFKKVDLRGLPLFVGTLGVVTTPVGGLSGLLLILLTDVGVGLTVGLIVGTIVLLAGPVLVLATHLGMRWRSYRRSRISRLAARRAG